MPDPLEELQQTLQDALEKLEEMRDQRRELADPEKRIYRCGRPVCLGIHTKEEAEGINSSLSEPKQSGTTEAQERFDRASTEAEEKALETIEELREKGRLSPGQSGRWKPEDLGDYASAGGKIWVLNNVRDLLKADDFDNDKLLPWVEKELKRAKKQRGME